MHHGSCLCGEVSFDVSGELAAPDACHCTMCRKQSGHYWASTDIERKSLRLRGEDKLNWYQASEKVRRGFCSCCGSFLFWDPLEGERIAIAMGAFDSPSRTRLEKHIFVADKGDYYAIADGLPQNER